jgi:hypothetical protein
LNSQNPCKKKWEPTKPRWTPKRKPLETSWTSIRNRQTPAWNQGKPRKRLIWKKRRPRIGRPIQRRWNPTQKWYRPKWNTGRSLRKRPQWNIRVQWINGTGAVIQLQDDAESQINWPEEIVDSEESWLPPAGRCPIVQQWHSFRKIWTQKIVDLTSFRNIRLCCVNYCLKISDTSIHIVSQQEHPNETSSSSQRLLTWEDYVVVYCLCFFVIMRQICAGVTRHSHVHLN